MIKQYINLLLFLSLSFNLCYSQDLVKRKISQKDRNGGVIEKYSYSGPEESAVLLLYQNGVYAYDAFTNFIGRQFSEGTWKRRGNILQLNSTYGPNRLPATLSFVQKFDTVPNIPIQYVLNSNGEVMENAIIAINDDSIKCSPIVNTCTGNFGKIERIRVFLGDCYSKWIKIDSKDFKALKLVIPLAINFDKYLAFDKRKYTFSKIGLKQATN